MMSVQYSLLGSRRLLPVLYGPVEISTFPCIVLFWDCFRHHGQAARILRKEWQRFAVEWATAALRQQEVQALRLVDPRAYAGHFT